MDHTLLRLSLALVPASPLFLIPGPAALALWLSSQGTERLNWRPCSDLSTTPACQKAAGPLFGLLGSLTLVWRSQVSAQWPLSSQQCSLPQPRPHSFQIQLCGSPWWANSPALLSTSHRPSNHLLNLALNRSKGGSVTLRSGQYFLTLLTPSFFAFYEQANFLLGCLSPSLLSGRD